MNLRKLLLEAKEWEESRSAAELRTAFDHRMPRWWVGRRIHAWHMRQRVIVYDEVGPFPDMRVLH